MGGVADILVRVLKVNLLFIVPDHQDFSVQPFVHVFVLGAFDNGVFLASFDFDYSILLGLPKPCRLFGSLETQVGVSRFQLQGEA